MGKLLAISTEAQRIMTAGFREALPAPIIVRKILEATGERIAERTVARRLSDWKAEQSRVRAAKEQIRALVETMQENPEHRDMVVALAQDGLLMDQDALREMDPAKRAALAIQADKLRLKAQELALKQSQHQLDREKFEALQRREAAAKAAVQEEALSPAERVAKVREIYGLAS